MPPTPSNGNTDSASTTNPMLPIHCVSCRQNRIEAPWASMSDRTVAPVAVNPETDSKIASSQEENVPAAQNGSAPARHTTSHSTVTAPKAVRVRMRCGTVVLRTSARPARPTTKPQASIERASASDFNVPTAALST